MSTNSREFEIEDAIRQAVGLERGVVLYRNAIGRVQDFRRDPPIWISYGLVPGSSDLIGIVQNTRCGCGRFVGLEVKQRRGRERATQERFRHLVQSLGGFAAIVRSPEQARAAIERARNGESQ